MSKYDSRLGLPQPIVGWIYNHSRKHYWRVAGWYEIDDLIQDGLMIAYKCLERYGKPTKKVPGRIQRVRMNEVDEPHFMRLVQSSFRNHMGELIRRKRRGDDNTSKFLDLFDVKDESTAAGLVSASIEPLQELAALIDDLPEHLRKQCLALKHRVRLNALDFETELRAFLWERENLGCS